MGCIDKVTLYYWPSIVQERKFNFLHTRQRLLRLNLLNINVAGYPTFDYTIKDAAAAQEDLVIAR